MSSYSRVVIGLIYVIVGWNSIVVCGWNLRQMFEEFENGSSQLTNDDYGNRYHGNTPSEANVVNEDTDYQPTTSYVIGMFVNYAFTDAVCEQKS